MFLRLDIGLAGFSLCIKRIEGLIQSILGGFAGIDGASDLAHERTPKNRGPDHFVPVIAVAMAVSEVQLLPFQR